MALIRVKNFPDRMYAERAQQTLADEGIESILQSPDIGILGAGGAVSLPVGVDLYGEEKAAARAGEILNVLFDGV